MSSLPLGLVLQLNVAQNIELFGFNDNNFNVNLSIFIITNKMTTINKENGNILSLSDLFPTPTVNM